MKEVLEEVRSLVSVCDDIVIKISEMPVVFPPAADNSPGALLDDMEGKKSTSYIPSNFTEPELSEAKLVNVREVLQRVGVKFNDNNVAGGQLFVDTVNTGELDIRMLFQNNTGGIAAYEVRVDNVRYIGVYGMSMLEFLTSEPTIAKVCGIRFRTPKGDYKFITGAVPLHVYHELISSKTKLPRFEDVFEILGWFFDPVRALGLALSTTGHWLLVDRPGSGKSTLISSVTDYSIVGTDYSEAALVYNARENTEGILLQKPGGYIGWDEVRRVEDEKEGFILRVLDGIAQRTKGRPVMYEHNCKFILSDNAFPEFSLREKLTAFVSRMQWVGGVSGDISERQEFYPEIARKANLNELFEAVHLASNQVMDNLVIEKTREVDDGLIKGARESFARAVQNAIDRFPVLIDGSDIVSEETGGLKDVSDLAKECASPRNELRIRRIIEVIEVFGDHEVEDTIEYAFSLTEIDEPSGDPVEKAIEAWRISLENNYGQHVAEGKCPPMKSALMVPLSEVEILETKFEDLL